MIFLISLIKLVSQLIKFFGLGAGATWPGHIALVLKPDILSSNTFRFKNGVVLISGTNGKTTTTKLLAKALKDFGFDVTSNTTGANLLNGIVSSILISFPLFTKKDLDVGVFEVDEASLPLVLTRIHPKAVVLLNLSRDQLDRYGETDIILNKWISALSCENSADTLFLNTEQSILKTFEGKFLNKINYFTPDRELLNKTKLKGAFNAVNLSAAAAVGKLFGVDKVSVAKSFEGFEAAYGRGESVEYEGKTFKILLAKNPASFNQNLDSIEADEDSWDTVLFVLNDNIPDGRDVSWIYDVFPEKLKKVCEQRLVFISGTRAFDMSIRLKYTGVHIDKAYISNSMLQTIRNITLNESCKKILAFPNYSAMLELRKILIGRKIL